ncbi:hypothetical protein BOX15_Mlig018254g1 [Macrostomum lignano]|uniref:LicD domain-containing protein n=2 Tax=Macrostomum lignano TaxID=282301 RepID=A0A1I8H982_9PLAT|nr:hypothetical protein BOX15_Mlig018254g1 [Macrostomum lignano]
MKDPEVAGAAAAADSAAEARTAARLWFKRFAQMRTGRFISTRSIVSINIFVLLVNTYVLIMQLSQSGHLKTEDYFYSPVTEQQAVQMRSVLRVFADAMKNANVTFFLCSGTLLGSLRHHGRIPWDDDVDVMVLVEQRQQMEAALKQLEPEYRLYRFMEWAALGKWKFFRADSDAFLLQPWSKFRWPYVDIFFVQGHNASHLRHAYYGDIYFRRKDLFPLQLRPYEGMMLPAPCAPGDFMRAEFQDPGFNWTLCQSRGFSHVMEVPLPHWRQRSLLCSRLASRFPFVYTATSTADRVTEVLKVGEKVLREFSFRPPACTGRA